MPDFQALNPPSAFMLAQSYGWRMHGGGYMHDSYWGLGGAAHAVVWLLITAAIVAATLLVSRLLGKGRSKDSSSALDRLDERYASGEIEREEYLQRKRDILER